MTVCLLPLCGCSSPYQSKGLVAPTQPQPTAQARQAAQPEGCSAKDVALQFGGPDSDFNGMSHSGTYLTLTNTGTHACRVPRRPEITLLDAKGTVIPAKVNVPPGMHPGPVMVPVLLAPGASARSGLRWVSGEVYDHNTCADLAKATVKLESGELTAPIQSHICGDASVGIRLDEPWLQLK